MDFMMKNDQKRRQVLELLQIKKQTIEPTNYPRTSSVKYARNLLKNFN